MSFYTRDELASLGLKSFGEDVRISKKASLYNPGNISLGNHVRIDDFCVLSAGAGGIFIGDYVHIAVFCSLIGAGKITLDNFSGLSSRVSIYSSNEDYSGKYLTNPTVPAEFTGVTSADVYIGKHVIIGSGSILLPGVTLGEGCSVGALSLVKKGWPAFSIIAGSPAKRVGERKRDLLELERKLLREANAAGGNQG